MTYLRSSNTPPFPSPERPAACSLPIALTRPSRHSSRHCPCGARWHATFTGDFRLRGDTRPPTARSVALDVAAESDHVRLGRDRFYQTCAPRDCPHDPTGCVAFPDTARLIETRAVSRNPIAVQGEAKMNKNELVSHVAAETSATRGQRRAHGGGRVLRHRRRPRAGRTRRHRGLKDAVVQGGEGPSRRGQRIAWGAKRPGACRSSRQRLRRRRTPSPCIGVEALGLENGSFPCACVRPIYEPALHASRGRPTHFTPRAIGLPTGPTRWGAGRLGQERSVGVSAIRRPREHMRNRARRLNPLARGFIDTVGCEFSPATGLRTGAHAKCPTRYRPACGRH